MSKKRTGRPRAEKNPEYETRFAFKCSVSLRELIRRAAREKYRRDSRDSDWAREVLEAAARRELGEKADA